jgi:metal-responsive CopG/Arc/MetJ family transcriptional regulator
MSVVIELDENLVSEIDAMAKGFNKNRLDYINESLQKALNQDRKKRKYTDEEVRQMYAEAYRKNPQTKEEIDEWEEVQHWED